MAQKKQNTMSAIIAGDVRPSQVIWTYGPGAVIDLQNVSVIVLGLNKWEGASWSPVRIVEPRLLAQVKRIFPYVKELRVPPVAKENPFGEERYKNNVGVPVSLFPRWYRCRKCGLLSSIDSGSIFEVKGDSASNLRVVHRNCPKASNRSAPAVPARFLLACKEGHISDFPWREYVHGGPTSCKGTLRFSEVGSSLQTDKLLVKCEGCGKVKNMSYAFGQRAKQHLPSCPGLHPHFANGKAKNCSQDVKTLMLGASNGWFPKVLSVLSLPKDSDVSQSSLKFLVGQAMEDLLDLGVSSKEELQVTLSKKIFQRSHPKLCQYETDDIWETFNWHLTVNTDDESAEKEVTENIKLPEWRSLTSPQIPFKEDEFEADDGGVPEGFNKFIKRVVLVRRLKEVRALVGFTRLEAEDPMLDEKDQPLAVKLSADDTHWLPAMEMLGEGIFVQFNEEAVQAWEARLPVQKRENQLRLAHVNWRKARNLPEGTFPGIRYVLLHTFAHVMIRELSLSCGYSSASISERIYASATGEEPMAGVLLYTSASDSDGTLGGLVDLGNPENFQPLLREALNQARICSSDPLCSEYDPNKQEDASLDIHLAACHACTYVAETSCEASNRYLDRALLIDTLVGKEVAYFDLS